MKTIATLLSFAAAVTNAHMIMKTPVPAGQPDNSPLLLDGTNYPCKGLNSVASGQVNDITIGAPNTLSFTGSAVHGGGSCQVSLASTTEVNKDTKFMVIHSIEGGCPASASGNLPTDANGSGAAQFQFTVPDHPDLPPGSYTLAWTWHNKIGNREMYMNCANVMLTGAKKRRYAPSNMPVSKRQQAPLPEIFKANIANGCATVEGVDTQYPDPGASLETGSGAALGPPTGNCGAVNAAAPSSGSSPSSSAAGSATTPAAASGNTVVPNPSAVASSAPNNGQYTQSAGGVFATVSGAASQSTGVASQVVSAPAASQATSAPAVAATSAPATSATSAAAPAGTGASSTVAGAQSGPCSNEGAWSCAADGKSFQRCASGSWSVAMQMSAGMSCTPGVSSNFAYNKSAATNGKRDMRNHISRRRNNVHGAPLS